MGSLADAVRKLLINYLQVSALAAGFPLDWPGPMEVSLNKDQSRPLEAPPFPRLRTLCCLPPCLLHKQCSYSFAPLFIVGVSFAIWGSSHARARALARREGRGRGHRIDATATTPKDQAVLTLILLLYMIYPTICQQTLSMLAAAASRHGSTSRQIWRSRAGAIGILRTFSSWHCPGSFSTSLAAPLALFMMYRNRTKLGDHVVKFRAACSFLVIASSATTGRF